MTDQNDTGHDASALAHMRVLDLGGPTPQFATRLLGDLGADVIKIEPPGGDPLRSQAPFANGQTGPDNSIPFLSDNHNKRSVVLDLETDDGRDNLRRLAATADILVEQFDRTFLDDHGIGYADLSAANPRLIHAAVSAYGRFGPRRDYVGTELTVQAMNGVMYIHGDGEARPCMVPVEQLYRVAGFHTVVGVMAAIHARHRTGRGQQVDVSMQDVGLWQLMMVLGEYSFSQFQRRRVGSAPSNPGVSIFESRDGGYVQTSTYMDRHFTRLHGILNSTDISMEQISDPVWRRENIDLIDAIMVDCIGQRDRDEFVAEAQQRGIPSTPILKVSEFVNHPQPNSRDWFEDIDHPEIGTYRTAGAPYRMSKTPWRVRRPAPSIGQHTDEILTSLPSPSVGEGQGGGDSPHSGESRNPSELPESPSPESPATPPESPAPSSESPAKAGAHAAQRAASETGNPPVPAGAQNGHIKPLEGIRVVDFTQAVAGPVSTSFLAFLGADVIKVETSAHPQARRPDAPGFAELNRNKRSVTIDAQNPEGLEVTKRLVAESDVVIDNWRAGVMDRMGLGYDELTRVKPDIIAVQMPGLGLVGPSHHFTTYGQQIFGFCGLGYIWGHVDSIMTARPKLGYTDYVAASATVGAVLTALEHRDRTGEGQFIEVAQLEALASSLGVLYMDYSINGVDAIAKGNNSERFAPHEVYGCIGHDAWCAIVCRDDDDWRRLVIAMESPAWARDSRWNTLEGRVAGKEELDRRIGEWTAAMNPQQVFDRLQRNGVPAGMDQGPDKLVWDPHLRERESVVTVQPPAPWAQIPPLTHPALSARLSETPAECDTPAPTQGQHNEDIYRNILHLSDEEIEKLTESGALV